eukprot:jgi/Mesen1/6568/ME000336S05790
MLSLSIGRSTFLGSLATHVFLSLPRRPTRRMHATYVGLKRRHVCFLPGVPIVSFGNLPSLREMHPDQSSADRSFKEECIFCQVVKGSTSGHTNGILHRDEEVVAFADIRPAAFKHYLVVPTAHVKTINDLQHTESDCHLGTIDHGERRSSSSSSATAAAAAASFTSSSSSTTSFTSSSSSSSALPPPSFSSSSTAGPSERKGEKIGKEWRMVAVGQELLRRDAPLAPSYRWRKVKYMALGGLGAYISADALLERLNQRAGLSETLGQP